MTPDLKGLVASKPPVMSVSARVKRHGDGEQLEQRAELVGTERIASEQRLGPRPLIVVGIEIRQAHARQELAGRDVEHDAAGAERGEARPRRGELAAHDLLDAEIERQDQRRLARLGIRQALLEAVLDPGQPLIFDPDIADQMCGQRALRVDAVPLGAKADARQAEADDGGALGFGDMALEPHEAPRLRQPGQQLVAIDAIERGREPARRRRRIEHLGGIGIDRGLQIVGGEQCTVTIDDVGAAQARHCARHRPATDRVVALPQREVDEAEREHQQGQREEAADQPQPALTEAYAGIDRRPHRASLRACWRPAAGAPPCSAGKARRSAGLSRSGISPPDGKRAIRRRSASSRSRRSGISSTVTI